MAQEGADHRLAVGQRSRRLRERRFVGDGLFVVAEEKQDGRRAGSARVGCVGVGAPSATQRAFASASPSLPPLNSVMQRFVANS